MDYDYTLEFSREQRNAAKELFDNFLKGFHLQLLIGCLQGGKSGCYLSFACMLLYYGLVDKCVVVCGMADLNLKNQMLENKDECINTKFRSYMQNVFNLEPKEIKSKIDMLKKKLIIVGNDINKYKDDVSNTCFINDECHYAQDKDMKINTNFLKRGICVNGDHLDFLKNKNIYIVNVSATPFSEVANFINHNQEQYKAIVFLEPPPRYIGIGHFWRNGQIIAYDPTDELAFMELIFHLLSKLGNNDCGIIRILSNIRRHNCVEQIAKRVCVDVVVHNSKTVKYETNHVKSVSDLGRNNKPTLYILEGMGRCGHVFSNKDKTKFVMETSINPLSCTMDQGLLGREAGIDANDSIQIYLPKTFVESGDIERYIELTENKNIHSIPFHSRNIVPPPRQRKSHKTPDNPDENPLGDAIYPIEILNCPIDFSKYSKLSKSVQKELKDLMIEHLSQKEGRYISKNEPKIIDELRSQLMDEETKLSVTKINMTSNKAYLQVPKLINKANAPGGIPVGLGSGCGSLHNSLRFFIFEDEMEEIPKGKIFLDGRIEIPENRPEPKIGTSEKESTARPGIIIPCSINYPRNF